MLKHEKNTNFMYVTNWAYVYHTANCHSNVMNHRASHDTYTYGGNI